ncbi:MAG: anti-sigma factor family protein [Candidatus Kapaibacteriota bacterium]
MGIDKFINDYLDGNLNPEDDKEFRDLLENDVSAREEFDLMMSIHTILKEDAESITLPKYLEEKVEERLLANYLKVVSSASPLRSRKFAYSVLTFILIFFFSINNINDGKLPFNISFFLSEVLRQRELLQNQVFALAENDLPSNKKSVFLNSSFAKEKQTKSGKLANNIVSIELSDKFIERNNFIEISRTAAKQINAYPLENEVNKELFSTKPRAQNIYSTYISTINPRVVNSFNTGVLFNNINEITTKAVVFTGFSTFPLMKFGYSEKNLKFYSIYSQSIGYKVADKFRLGLEFGFFDFDYQSMTTILVPALEGADFGKESHNKNIKDKGNDAIILTNEYDNQNPRFIQVTVPIERKYQHYWGSVFLDYEMPVTKYLSVVGRINVGATSEGFLGGIVLFTELQPINGVAMHLGVENKSYWSSIPMDRSSFKTLIGLVYGVSIKFNFDNY